MPSWSAPDRGTDSSTAPPSAGTPPTSSSSGWRGRSRASALPPRGRRSAARCISIASHGFERGGFMGALLRNRILMFAALAIVLCGPAYAEDGRITGVVRDATGAALPGATVTITNEATGATQSVVAGSDGSYSVSVPPGVYSVSVSLRGCSRQGRREVRVTDAGSTAADFGLEAGREEEVTVTAM